MSKRSFSKRVIRKIKRTLKLDEAQEIIRKEFTDSKGNKMNMSIDVKPQNPKEPTIEWNRQYKE